MPPGGRRSLVVVPTYNERASISEVVEGILEGEAAEVLVVDDRSPDGTSEIVRALAGGRNGVHLLTRPSKGGLGSAYRDGFEWALGRGYGAVVEMDGDLSHDPGDVPRLLRGLEDADLCIGSRYVEGGRVENWGRWRRALSLAGNAYARLLLGFEVRDSTSGFRAFRAEWLRTLELDAISSDGYGFQIETTWRTVVRGGRILEIPIVFSERAGGRSKLSRKIVFEALLRVTAWGLARRFG